jgi:hypothetical protein
MEQEDDKICNSQECAKGSEAVLDAIQELGKLHVMVCKRRNFSL